MKKDNLVDHIPVPYKISEWGNPPEIVYSCPKCGETFHFYADQEKFCHNCGHKIYWDTCNRYLNPEHRRARFDPFVDTGIVALDACTAHSRKVNCFVLEI